MKPGTWGGPLHCGISRSSDAHATHAVPQGPRGLQGVGAAASLAALPLCRSCCWPGQPAPRCGKQLATAAAQLLGRLAGRKADPLTNGLGMSAPGKQDLGVRAGGLLGLGRRSRLLFPGSLESHSQATLDVPKNGRRAPGTRPRPPPAATEGGRAKTPERTGGGGQGF